MGSTYPAVVTAPQAPAPPSQALSLGAIITAGFALFPALAGVSALLRGELSASSGLTATGGMFMVATGVSLYRRRRWAWWVAVGVLCLCAAVFLTASVALFVGGGAGAGPLMLLPFVAVPLALLLLPGVRGELL